MGCFYFSLLISEFKAVLPLLISHESFIEVFHRIVDLSLVSYAIYRIAIETETVVFNPNHSTFIEYFKEEFLFNTSNETSQYQVELFDAIINDNTQSAKSFWSQHFDFTQWNNFMKLSCCSNTYI